MKKIIDTKPVLYPTGNVIGKCLSFKKEAK